MSTLTENDDQDEMPSLGSQCSQSQNDFFKEGNGFGPYINWDKHAFRVSEKVMSKPASSATETTEKWKLCF